MTTLEAVASIATIGSFLAILIGWVTRPLRQIRKDLEPLTERNSDGESVFDEVRVQVRQLVDEFPKNGVPTRSAVDAIKLDLAQLRLSQSDMSASLAELRGSQDAHIRMHLAGIPEQRKSSGEH